MVTWNLIKDAEKHLCYERMLGMDISEMHVCVVHAVSVADIKMGSFSFKCHDNVWDTN